MIKSSNPDASYTILNISLEFDTVTNRSLASQIGTEYMTVTNISLASQIGTEYMKSSILYDRILRSCIIPLNKSDISFSGVTNNPSKSLKGVLLLFRQERGGTKFERDTEEFYNTKITKVKSLYKVLLTNCLLRTWNTATSMMKLLNTLERQG